MIVRSRCQAVMIRIRIKIRTVHKKKGSIARDRSQEISQRKAEIGLEEAAGSRPAASRLFVSSSALIASSVVQAFLLDTGQAIFCPIYRRECSAAAVQAPNREGPEPCEPSRTTRNVNEGTRTSLPDIRSSGARIIGSNPIRFSLSPSAALLLSVRRYDLTSPSCSICMARGNNSKSNRSTSKLSDLTVHGLGTPNHGNWEFGPSGTPLREIVAAGVGRERERLLDCTEAKSKP
ncbi:hypothetical protein B0T24DRAFT_156735 [Lasiosphaeria ovina]|uniref:Uncharacterized protein n=1 Tax=Lasiosphaeria ovina TaxID=92902 RepID=A0AAE0KMG1_9PEZI|nr:hypothetical protein B0T24DRAFT_156735 [Lasiosphaeria ovina]